MNAIIAAPDPTARVFMPDFHQGEDDQRLLIEPMRKKVSPVATEAETNGLLVCQTNDMRGIEPHARNATNVAQPDLNGECKTGENPILFYKHSFNPSLII